MARKSFCFGAAIKKISRPNKKILVRLFQRNGTAISAVSAPKREGTVLRQTSKHLIACLSLPHRYPTWRIELVFDSA
nr:hypothetical protein [Porphyromonas gulae]